MAREYTFPESPAPIPYEAQGLEENIQTQFGCKSEYTNKWYEVSEAIVHRFRLIGHEGAEECFAIPLPGELYLYPIEGEIAEPEDAVRKMRHERDKAERAKT